MNKKLFSLSCALITAFIWGTAFVAQDMGMDHIGPLTFTSARQQIMRSVYHVSSAENRREVRLL